MSDLQLYANDRTQGAFALIPLDDGPRLKQLVHDFPYLTRLISRILNLDRAFVDRAVVETIIQALRPPMEDLSQNLLFFQLDLVEIATFTQALCLLKIIAELKIHSPAGDRPSRATIESVHIMTTLIGRAAGQPVLPLPSPNNSDLTVLTCKFLSEYGGRPLSRAFYTLKGPSGE